MLQDIEQMFSRAKYLLLLFKKQLPEYFDTIPSNCFKDATDIVILSVY